MDTDNLSIHIGLPSLALFHLPPHAPEAIPPEVHGNPTFLRPITIPSGLFHYFVDIRVATTIATAYLTAAMFFNRLNYCRRNKPHYFSSTTLFKSLVLLHNIFLAGFSAWVFYGVCHTLQVSWPAPGNSNYSVHLAHYLCRINDSGRAVYATTLGHDVPQSTDPLWGQGLAYYSWIFYVMKYYEVFDTVIIVVKGKRCSFLQMYHHAGVMIFSCLLVKYMAPACLVGLVLNSAVHALMVCKFRTWLQYLLDV